MYPLRVPSQGPHGLIGLKRLAVGAEHPEAWRPDGTSGEFDGIRQLALAKKRTTQFDWKWGAFRYESIGHGLIRKPGHTGGFSQRVKREPVGPGRHGAA